MRLLFEIDLKDYDPKDHVTIRDSARSIIIKNGQLAMAYSSRYDYYKFPGGGIEKDEDAKKAMIRETKEEVGLQVIESSIIPYGIVHRKQKSRDGGIFIQDNYYYLCQTEDFHFSNNLDDYEEEAGFVLRFVDPLTVLKTNREHDHHNTDQLMLERECLVIEMLIKEKILKKA